MTYACGEDPFPQGRGQQGGDGEQHVSATESNRSEAASAASLIGGHSADEEDILFFHDAVVRAYREGRVAPVTYAVHEDQVALLKTGKQIYGTYGGCGPDGERVGSPPVADPARMKAFWHEHDLPTPDERCRMAAARQAHARDDTGH